MTGATLSGVVRKRHLRDGAELNFEGIHLGREGGRIFRVEGPTYTKA